MTWKFLRGVLMDEVNGDGSDLGGGAAAEPGADGALPGAGGDPAGAGEPKGATTEGMFAEIKQGLAAGGIGGDEAIQTQADKDAAAAKAAAPGAQPDPNAVKPDKAAADKLAADALLKKKPDDFKLTDQEKAVLGPKAQARYQELTHYGRAQYERAERTQQEAAQITSARDNMLKTFADAKATASDMATLLNFNYQIKTGDHESALAFVNQYRAELLKRLGREAPGVDLLAEHADLKDLVDNNEMSRATALEVANARRATAANQQNQSQQQNQQRQQQQVQQTQEAALGAIQAWCTQTATADIDYAAREARLVPQIAEIMREYQPHQWLPTIKRLYSTISVAKAPVIPLGGNSLRPNGAKPGPKAANNMLDAIKTGLGYSAAN